MGPLSEHTDDLQRSHSLQASEPSLMQSKIIDRICIHRFLEHTGQVCGILTFYLRNEVGFSFAYVDSYSYSLAI